MTTADLVNHIRLDERGVAWIDDTRSKVIEVAMDHLAHGWSAEEIHRQHSHLSLAQTHAALAFYYDHQPEFDAAIAESNERADELAAENADSPGRLRLPRVGLDPVRLRLYMDVHAPLAITEALRQRGVDVLTSQEDGTERLEDPPLLDRATALGRVLFTQDEDFLGEASRRQRSNQPFVGIVYAHQMRVTIGQCVRDLELVAKAYEPSDMTNRVEHLPLK